MSMPPVSMTLKFLVSHSARAYMRSRVTPAVSSVIDNLEPTRRLNKDDFPTLGRPTIATL